MSNPYQLMITCPGDDSFVERNRHIAVEGTLTGSSPLPEDALLSVYLLDARHQLVRLVETDRKNDRNCYLEHPDLTRYPAPLDPDGEGLRAFGFPPLMVRDLQHPEESLRDGSIKAWYSDTRFKAILVCATDRAHGLVADDGIGYLDGFGHPYTSFPAGSYTILITLHSSDGTLLGETSREITVGDRTRQAICRFNPVSHKNRMVDWCDKNGFSVIKDLLPGYLDPYLGTWYYHMGLLKMYRANDLALFVTPTVHMFLYLIDPTSTSYETELAYLQTQGKVNPQDLHCYYYDIGEAKLGSQTGTICEFDPEEYLHIYRLDIVNETAKEDCFALEETGVERSFTDLSQAALPAGCRFAITGVFKPYAMDPSFFTDRGDHTYTMKNRVAFMRYRFSVGSRQWEETRPILMDRTENGSSIGTSVFEFYHLFATDRADHGETVRVSLTGIDSFGQETPVRGVLSFVLN